MNCYKSSTSGSPAFYRITGKCYTIFRYELTNKVVSGKKIYHGDTDDTEFHGKSLARIVWHITEDYGSGNV